MVACGSILVGLAWAQLGAQEVRPPDKVRPQPFPRQARVWRSATTGREYSVWVENERFHAEWVNIPPMLVQGGAYIRSECRRVGMKWVGTSRSYLPCETEGSGKVVRNWCHLLTRIEIENIAADRIDGRGEALRRFDCRTCKILETYWANFVWVPKDTGRHKPGVRSQ